MGSATVRCEYPRSSDTADRSLAELVVSGLFRTLLTFGCVASDVTAVSFEHRSPGHLQAYAAAFGGAERFARPFTGIEFSARILDRPHIHGNPELETLLCDHAERTLRRIGQPVSGSAQALTILRRHRPSGRQLSMEDVARELGCSVRSLRRRLEQEGTTFRVLQQMELESSAYALLRDSKLTIQAIAHRLGFANVAAFHRAFKRWTPLTPTEYRRSNGR
jgi:AraC-like DNA-binding protein